MGLGELGALAAAYHRAARRAQTARVADHDAALERLGDLQHQLEERDGWSLEQKASSW